MLDDFTLPLRHLENTRADPQAAYPPEARSTVSRDHHAIAAAEITRWPGYAPTPLHALPDVAGATGVTAVWYKDEGRRFGLGSFKALGGAYGVLRALQAGLAQRGIPNATSSAIRSGEFRDYTSTVTVTTATDGNHGKSVAWGAQLFGCRSRIYLPQGVSPGREAAIRAYGAETVRVDGNYDQAVRQAQEDSSVHGYVVVSDTSYAGYTDIPCDVMRGYGVLAQEIIDQLPAGEIPSHVFLQAGVGAFAAAVYGHLWETWGARRPTLIVVEPRRADCVLRAVAAGRPIALPGDHDTLMACLAAGEVSILAWPMLVAAARHFLAIEDEAAARAMRLLADGLHDVRIVAGESGVAGFAGFLCAAADAGVRQALGLDDSARVLLIGTEGATDPETYERIVGHPPEAGG